MNAMQRQDSRVSRFFLTILADLSNIVVLIVSLIPLNSSCSNLLSKPLGTNSSAPAMIGITVTYMFNNLFCLFWLFCFVLFFVFCLFFSFFYLVLWQGPCTCLSFRFLLFSLNGLLEQLNLQNDKIFSSCEN